MSDEIESVNHPPYSMLRFFHAGMQIPGQVIRLDLYRLLCHVHTSEYLSNLSDMGDFCPWQSLRDDFEASEIVRILLQTSVMVRFIGFGHADEARSHRDALSEPVGELFKDTRRPESESLQLREACNKIIHAHNIVLDSNSVTKISGSKLGGEQRSTCRRLLKSAVA